MLRGTVLLAAAVLWFHYVTPWQWYGLTMTPGWVAVRAMDNHEYCERMAGKITHAYRGGFYGRGTLYYDLPYGWVDRAACTKPQTRLHPTSFIRFDVPPAPPWERDEQIP